MIKIIKTKYTLPGGTTLSAALSAIFFYLSRYPTVYILLATEIRDTFSGLDIKSGAQLSSCKYLRACIDETLRMSPPFLATFWREPYLDHTEPFVVDVHVIPPGTIAGVNPDCVMHNEEYFSDPFVFRQERWLTSEEGSSGLVIAKTLWYFDFGKASGEAGKLGEGQSGNMNGRGRIDKYQLFDLAVVDHDGPNLVFALREEYWRELSDEGFKA
ncbi:hypothetical protein ABEW05_000209 [Botrytis cinerea]